MDKTQEKEGGWDKAVYESTLRSIEESLARGENIGRSLKALSNSLNAELGSIKNLLESLEDQIEKLGK